jgi:hypothetical protein
MFRPLVFTVGLLASSAASSQVWYYTEYENESYFSDVSYVDNSSINHVRFGAQGDIFYIELGPAENDGEWGSSLEAGYKYNITDHFEVSGEIETVQLDAYEGDIGSRVETRVRYYF